MKTNNNIDLIVNSLIDLIKKSLFILNIITRTDFP